MKQLSCRFHAPLSISLHHSWRLPHSYHEQKVQKSTYTASATITASSGDRTWQLSPAVMRELACVHAQSIMSRHLSHVTQCIIIYRNSTMVAGRMDPSILNEISLWYQDVEVSKLFYLLLKGCGHLYNLESVIVTTHSPPGCYGLMLSWF